MDWQVVLAVIIVWVPVVILWLYTWIKVLKADRSTAWKAAWIIAILVLPFIGAIFFLLFGHRSAAYEVATGLGGPDTRGEMTDAEVLEQLERYRADGQISQEDYEAMMARHGGGPPATTPPPA